ncbi:MAG: hypothetical protein EOM74_02050 [Methanomicrobia archaeon]|nr:hypothetical protein [Methanomicrobia archaeon]
MTRDEWIILVASIVAALILIIALFPLLKRSFYTRNFVRIYYRDVYRIALYFDFFLINELILKLDDQNTSTLDHVIFGEKYIYAIRDKYLPGALSGKAEDQQWIYHPRHQRPKRIDNLLKFNRVRVEKMSLVTGLDYDLFISIVLVNDDLDLSEVEINSKVDYIVHRKDLYKLIKAIESRPVSKINEQELQQAVRDIDKINQKHELKRKR